PVRPCGPVTVVVEPLAERSVSRVVVVPSTCVTVAAVLLAVRSTWRVRVRPFGPVVVSVTWPSPRSTVRTALAPCGPVTVAWRVPAWAVAAASERMTTPAAARVAFMRDSLSVRMDGDCLGMALIERPGRPDGAHAPRRNATALKHRAPRGGGALHCGRPLTTPP